MKLAISNLLTIGALSIGTDKPLVLVAGPNAQGKTAICNAIELAMLGKPVRVDTKKALAEIVKDGQKNGSVRLELSGGQAYAVALPSGQYKEGAPDGNPYLPFSINPHSVAMLSAPELRKVLQRIAGVTMTHEAVVDRLTKRGRTKESIAQVSGDIRAGFDSAAAKAAKLAQDARANWRATTGEAYGEVKAVGWQAMRPAAVSEGDHEGRAQALREQLATAEAELRSVLPTARGKVSDELRQRAASLASHQQSLPTDLAHVESVKAKIAGLETAADGDTRDWIKCPCCDESLVLDKGALIKAQGMRADAVALRDLAAARSELVSAESNVTSRKAHIERAQAAAETIATMESEASAADPAAIASAESRVASLKGELSGAESILQVKRQFTEAMATAERKDREAAEFHALAVEYGKLADDLSPEGVPGELGAEILAAINPGLAQFAADAGFDPVSIGDDFRLRLNGRDYRLLSESEQWRACAVLGASIAIRQKTGMLVLDRFDVLHPDDRGPALDWLLDIAPDVGCVVVAGTFGKLPNVPDAHVVSMFPAASVAVKGVTA